MGSSVSPSQALGFLKELRIDLSGPLERRMLETRPEVVQVWFLANGVGQAIQILHGSLKLDRDGITWNGSDGGTQLRALFEKGGGQVLLRVHCGHLFDEKERPVSAALDCVTPFPNRAPTYGGVFEAWFFVNAG